MIWIGFRDYDSAEKMQQQAGDDYVIVTIRADLFDGEVLAYVVMRKDVDPVGTTKREWVGLTDEEFNDCLVGGDPCENLAEPEAWAVMKEVEAKLKEKNNG
jgi:hypothetical protein